MQRVIVNYRELRYNPHAIFIWSLVHQAAWVALIVPGVLLCSFLPILCGTAWQGQWLGFVAALLSYNYIITFAFLLRRRNFAESFRAYHTTTWTFLPEELQLDEGPTSKSRRSWASIEKFVPLADGTILSFRDHGRERIFFIPRDAFPTTAAYEAWQAQAEQWQQRAQVAQRPLPPGALTLTERWRCECQWEFDELQLDAAQRNLWQTHSQTLPRRAVPRQQPNWSNHLRGAASLLACALMIYDPTSREPINVWLNLALLASGVAIFVGYLKIMTWVDRRIEQATYHAQPPATVIFAEEGVLIQGQHEEHFHSWLAVDAVTVDAGRLLIWEQGSNCGNFPQRAFANLAEAQAVEHWIRTKIADRAANLKHAEFADEPELPAPQAVERINPYQAPQS